ncbi:hypothetical protein Lser_V15G08223 [Lactuca serriola]
MGLTIHTWRHGISLSTLYRRSNLCPGLSLLVVGDRKGAVFGGLVEAPLKPSTKKRYQGSNDTFVFPNTPGCPVIYRPTGVNRYFTLCSTEYLALGGGNHFALYLDSDLLNGSSLASETYGNSCLSHTQEFEVKEIEVAFRTFDMITDAWDLMNNIEKRILDLESQHISTHRSFATEEEREGISRNLQETEDWLYEDGDDESQQAYIQRLEDLRKLVDPIDNRYKEEDARIQATTTLSNSIKHYRKAPYSLSPSDKDAVYTECNKAEQWLLEKSQLQDSIPKNADPIFWSNEINRKAEVLERSA